MTSRMCNTPFLPLSRRERATRAARQVRAARSFNETHRSPPPDPLHAGRACPTCALLMPNSGKPEFGWGEGEQTHCLVFSSRQRQAFDLAAIAEAQLHRPHGARRRIDWEELAVDAIHFGHV